MAGTQVAQGCPGYRGKGETVRFTEKRGKSGPSSGKSSLHQLPSLPQDHWNRDLPTRSVPAPTGLGLRQPRGAPPRWDRHAQR